MITAMEVSEGKSTFSDTITAPRTFADSVCHEGVAVVVFSGKGNEAISLRNLARVRGNLPYVERRGLPESIRLLQPQPVSPQS